MNSNIILSVINKEKYSILADSLPHRDILDLMIVYRNVTETSDEGFFSVLVNNDMMHTLGMTEEELYEKAKENTDRLMPGSLEKIDRDFYVLSNSYRIFGAVEAFTGDEPGRLAEQYENSLYILPSSIHEVFIIPDYGQGAAYLRSVVREANRSVVKEKEVLSDEVYYYDYDERIIKIADED